MSDRPPYDPKDKAELSRIDKRGEHYTVTGHVDGQRVEAHIPAPAFEGQPSRAHAEALARRALLGTATLAREPREDHARD